MAKKTISPARAAYERFPERTDALPILADVRRGNVDVVELRAIMESRDVVEISVCAPVFGLCRIDRNIAIWNLHDWVTRSKAGWEARHGPVSARISMHFAGATGRQFGLSVYGFSSMTADGTGIIANVE